MADEIDWGPWGPCDFGRSSEDLQYQRVGGVTQFRYRRKREPIVQTFFVHDENGDYRFEITRIDGVVQRTATVEDLA